MVVEQSYQQQHFTATALRAIGVSFAVVRTEVRPVAAPHTSCSATRVQRNVQHCVPSGPHQVFLRYRACNVIATMPPKSKSAKPQKTREEKVEAAMADARAAGLPEGWSVTFNVSTCILSAVCGVNVKLAKGVSAFIRSYF